MEKIKIPKWPKFDIKLVPPELKPWIGPGTDKKIPPGIRKKVWENRFGKKKTGRCVCCREIPIHIEAFHCGHRRAQASGGSINETNLEPICQRCNLKMKKKYLLA